MSPVEWVQVATGIGTCLGVLALLLKNAGAWQHERESTDHELTAKVAKLEEAIDSEHTVRREKLEEVNVAIGLIREQQARMDERLKWYERTTGGRHE